jgi:hypothetical protein
MLFRTHFAPGRFARKVREDLGGLTTEHVIRARELTGRDDAYLIEELPASRCEASAALGTRVVVS